MALESGDYISDLNTSNPVGTTDNKAQGDDHLRLIKKVLKQTFPNATKPWRLPSTAAVTADGVTVATTDQNKLIPVNATEGAVTVALPSSPPDGFEVGVVKTDYSVNAVTVDGNSSDTINGELTLVLTKAYQQAWFRWSTAASAWFARVTPAIPTGSVLAFGGASAPVGWALVNGTNTIGKTGSGATYAGAFAEALYHYCYAVYSNTICPVSSGRSGNSATDWAAGKTLGLPTNWGERSVAGKGGSLAVGDTYGVDSITLTQAKLPTTVGQLPQTNLTLSSASEVWRGGDYGVAGTDNFVVTQLTRSAAKATITGFVPATDITNAGGGEAQDIRNKHFVQNWIMAF